VTLNSTVSPWSGNQLAGIGMLGLWEIDQFKAGITIKNLFDTVYFAGAQN
jgi:hypothetical protein